VEQCVAPGLGGVGDHLVGLEELGEVPCDHLLGLLRRLLQIELPHQLQSGRAVLVLAQVLLLREQSGGAAPDDDRALDAFLGKVVQKLGNDREDIRLDGLPERADGRAPDEDVLLARGNGRGRVRAERVHVHDERLVPEPRVLVFRVALAPRVIHRDVLFVDAVLGRDGDDEIALLVLGAVRPAVARRQDLEGAAVVGLGEGDAAAGPHAERRAADVRVVVLLGPGIVLGMDDGRGDQEQNRKTAHEKDDPT
jgi:hypothetical protein